MEDAGPANDCNAKMESSSAAGQGRFMDDDSSGSETECSSRPGSQHDSSFDSDSSMESDSSVEITHRKSKAARINIDSDDTDSDWDVAPSKQNQLSHVDDSSSSESDGQSEKCPICLAKFKGQEIGSPDSCDHTFCYECILEWSKNVTTCPIDRQTFTLILVKKHLDGAVIRQTTVIQMQQPELVDAADLLDPTYCEVCGACDREDRMLLCDGCDFGYHLECLTPPLEHVPLGSWLCADCESEGIRPDALTIYLNELEELYNDAEEFGAPANARRVPRRTNVVPRTRQSDRIRAQIISNRQNRVSTVVTVAQTSQPSTSRTTTTTRKRRKRRKTRKAAQVKITYEVDEATGKKIVIETKSYRKSRTRKRRRKRKRSTRKRVVRAPPTAKRRLAQHVGICAPSKPGQSLPDMRVASSGENQSRLNRMRSQSGIPVLRLFSDRDALEYFSGSDDAGGDGDGDDGNLLVARRRPTQHDAAVLRRGAQRKSRLLLPSAAAASSVDLLDSIMHSQERMHAKNAVMSLNTDGSLSIANRERVDLTNERHFRTRNVPSYSTNDDPANIASVHSPQDDGRSAVTISNNSVSTSTNAASNSTLSASRESPSDLETVSTSKALAEDKDDDLSADVAKKAAAREEEKSAEEAAGEDAQEEDVSSTTNVLARRSDEPNRSVENTDDEECPNFSIYSKDTINLVANRNLEQDEVGSTFDMITDEQEEQQDDHPQDNEDIEAKPEENTAPSSAENNNRESVNRQNLSMRRHSISLQKHSLYSDSDEEVVKTDARCSFGIGDIRDITEDISDEERSYTPCLDERGPVVMREGLEGLDTEAISEDERNDFDEANEHRATSDAGDALEINAKESELDFTKPEDYEEGEIVDRLKRLESASGLAKLKMLADEGASKAREVKKKEQVVEEPAAHAEPIHAAFKRISRNANRHYRQGDKDRLSRSHSKERNKERTRKREGKKEKRKELERYNVRNVVTEKPRKSTKDKFGRDARRRSASRGSSRSPSCRSRSFSRERRKRRSRSRCSRSRSRKRSFSRKRRSPSRTKRRRRTPIEEKKPRKKLPRSSPLPPPAPHQRIRSPASRSRSRTPPLSAVPPRRSHRDWEQPMPTTTSSRWPPSPSRSRSPALRQATPSWTPPRLHESAPGNLTVILTNDAGKPKKKEKRKGDKRRKDGVGGGLDGKSTRKRRRDRSPLPSKEVFASGDNILVSVSFNKDAEEAAATTATPGGGGSRRMKTVRAADEVSTRRTRKERQRRERTRTRTPPTTTATTTTTSSSAVLMPLTITAKTTRRRKQPTHDLSGIKPVAIIDLDRSPFKELTPSPKDVIVLSDSDHSPEEKVAPDSSQPAAEYAPGGPKTPPEPQVKFSLPAKALQLRQISNPLHDPDDEPDDDDDDDDVDVNGVGDHGNVETAAATVAEIDPQDELEQRLNDAMHKGPNTPSEPPNSPPSSPDAYDPFDPTKSRSPTPEPIQVVVGVTAMQAQVIPNDSSEPLEKLPLSQTPELLGAATKSHTPPLLAEIQPADSQTSLQMGGLVGASTPEDTLAEKHLQLQAPSASAQGSSPIFTPKLKPSPGLASASTPTSSSATAAVVAAAAAQRVSILNSTIILPLLGAPPPQSSQPPPSHTLLPSTSGLLKPSPTKASVKLMPKRASIAAITKPPAKGTKINRSTDSNDSNMDLDSPYSPGPSDFEDLFEPPAELKHKAKPVTSSPSKPVATGNKLQSTFDNLFGSPGGKTKSSKSLDKPKKITHPKIKQVGVKFDEDSLKILDELPNSAVEMQVKDKFLKKLNRQERVVEEVKLVLKPHYNKKHINKEEYKDILRRAVPKICHNKAGEINPKKIQNLIEAYVKKVRHTKKVSSSSSSVSMQK